MSYLDIALPLAERGWAVHPLRAGTKRPALHGNTPGNPCPRAGACVSGHQGWEQRATTDPDKLAWFGSSQKFADCNVGIACGPSGLLVIDLDLPKPGKEIPERWTRRGHIEGAATLAALCEASGQSYDALWETFTVRTARGGWHLYFRLPEGVALRNTEGETGAGLGPLIDTRSHGGYVVGPGSSTSDGRYEITNDAPARVLPGWLVTALTPRPLPVISAPAVLARAALPRYVEAAIANEKRRLSQALSGAHATTRFTAGIALGQLCGAGVLPPGTAEAELISATSHMLSPDCDCTPGQIQRDIERGIAKGMRQPRVIAERTTAPTAALFDKDAA